MPLTKTGLVRKRFDAPDEVRPFEGGTGQFNVLETEAGVVGRAEFKPGWRWSEHVKPIVKTDSCQAAHVGYVISGRMRVQMDDGTTEDFAAGDLMVCPPGHDAWILGGETTVILDWAAATNYAKS
jgi:quercetin dioxygenase-like cupin family protein